MPTYDYRCPNGHDFEHFFRKISDATAELACPTCGALAERRVSGGAGLVFKGSGFYLTDYGKNAHRKGGGDNGGGESKSAASGDSAPVKAESSKSEGASAKSDGSTSTKSDSTKSEAKSSPKPKGDAS